MSPAPPGGRDGAIVGRSLDLFETLELQRAGCELAGSPLYASVLDAVGLQPTTLEQVVVRTGLEPTAAVLALDDLVRDGWVDEVGGWYERAAKPGG